MEKATVARLREQEQNLIGLLQTPAVDNFAASCPNPGVLQRCEAGPRLDRFNIVVPSMRGADAYDSEALATARAEALACSGTHQHGDLHMPCATHEQYDESLRKRQ